MIGQSKKGRSKNKEPAATVHFRAGARLEQEGGPGQGQRGQVTYHKITTATVKSDQDMCRLQPQGRVIMEELGTNDAQ